MNDIIKNTEKWESVLKNFKIHLIPVLNPEGYLISTSAIRKLIPREMSQEEAEKICKKYYQVYKEDDAQDAVLKKHILMFENVDYNCIPDKYIRLKKSVKNIFEKNKDLPTNCLHIWSANGNGIDIQANSKLNPKISQILNGEDIFMNSKRHNILNISHPGPINCPFDKEKGFIIEKETKAITSLLETLQKQGTLFAYLNYHSAGGIIFQRPAITTGEQEWKSEDILKKEIVNYIFAKTYQDKTYKNTGIGENGENKKENSKYIIHTKASKATSVNDFFRLEYPTDLLIELSGMGGNPIGPYGDITGNYTNAMISNLEAIKYTLDVANVAQMIAESSYKVIKKIDSKTEYEKIIGIQDMIYEEFSKNIKKMQKAGVKNKNNYER